MSFFVNATMTMQGTFTDAGRLIAASVRLTVMPPNGVKEYYTDCTGGGGVYERDYTPSQAGLYNYAFEDLNTGAYQNGTFEVASRPV